MKHPNLRGTSVKLGFNVLITIWLFSRIIDKPAKNIDLFAHLNTFGNTLLCLIVVGWVGSSKEMHRRKVKIFWNRREGFLGHSFKIIKWTWGFFPEICNLTPYNQAQKGTSSPVSFLYSKITWEFPI